MPTVAERLAKMAREDPDPEERAWAAAEYQAETGKPLEQQQSAPGPWREGFIGRSPIGQLMAAKTPKEDVGQVAAGFLGGGQGASFGTSDELSGVVAGLIQGTRPGRWIGEKTGLLSRDVLGNLRGIEGRLLERANGSTDPSLTGMVTGEQPAGFGESYRAGRDAAREELATAREQYPKTSYGMEVGAALLNPVKAPIKGPVGPGVGRALARIGAGGVRGAAEGAAYAAGASEADLTEGDVAGFGRDVGSGAALGGLVGGGVSAVGETGRAVGGAIKNRLKKRLANEFVEGMESTSTSTQRAHVEKAKEDIFREATEGPDAKTVRNVRYQGAEEGREALEPILERARTANQGNYAAFVKAGRGNVDAGDYWMRLAEKAQKADDAGDLELYRGLTSMMDEVEEAAARGPLSLTRLRGMTTQVQKHAASAVGGLNLHAPAELKNRLSAVATEAMDDSLSAAAAGDEALEAVASDIRKNNRQIYTLATVDKNLALRQTKEGTGPGLLVRGAKAAATPGALAAGAAIAGDDDERLENALYGGFAGAGLRALVPLAKLAQRKGTDIGLSLSRPGGGRMREAAMRSVRPLTLLDVMTGRRQQE